MQHAPIIASSQLEEGFESAANQNQHEKREKRNSFLWILTDAVFNLPRDWLAAWNIQDSEKIILITARKVAVEWWFSRRYSIVEGVQKNRRADVRNEIRKKNPNKIIFCNLLTTYRRTLPVLVLERGKTGMRLEFQSLVCRLAEPNSLEPENHLLGCLGSNWKVKRKRRSGETGWGSWLGRAGRLAHVSDLWNSLTPRVPTESPGSRRISPKVTVGLQRMFLQHSHVRRFASF